MAFTETTQKALVDIFTSEIREIRTHKMKSSSSGYKHGQILAFTTTGLLEAHTDSKEAVAVVYGDIDKNETIGKVIIRGVLDASQLQGIASATKVKIKTELNKNGIFLENLDEVE